MMISHLVAASQNLVIGNAGQLPWHLPEDLKHFKKLTMGSCIIMGRKTFESIGRPLPGRLNVVVSRHAELSGDNLASARSFAEALALCKNQSRFRNDEVFVVGGGEIYRETLPLTGRIYLTAVHQEVAGDTTYPAFADQGFTEVARVDHQQGALAFSFVQLDRDFGDLRGEVRG